MQSVNEDGYFILWLRGGLMSYFSVQFCPQWSDALQNWRSWGSILFLKGAVFSVLTEASRVTQTGKRRSKEGWFCSQKSRSMRGSPLDCPWMPRNIRNQSDQLFREQNQPSLLRRFPVCVTLEASVSTENTVPSHLIRILIK